MSVIFDPILGKLRKKDTSSQTTIVGITGTKAQFDTAVTDGDFMYIGDAPTAHTHLLAAGATDVTVTATNLNTLDDGLNTNLHFHDADRARANHTGSQLASTISDFASSVIATVLTGISFVTGTAVVATDSILIAIGKLQKQNTDQDTAIALNTAKVTNATHTGDAEGATALTVKRINGVALSGLTTGILKNTTTTGVPSIAVNADLPAMSATVGGAVPTPPNNTTTFLRGDGTFATPTASATITTQDEGTPLSSTVTTLNFTGAGVTASGAGAITTINIPGGAGGLTTGQTTVDFGAKTNRVSDTAVVTVSTASVATASIINVSLFGGTTADHDPEDVIIEEIQAYPTNIVNGVSFDIMAIAPNNSWGKYLVNYSF